MKRYLTLFLFFLLIVNCFAENRLALVIGNSDYPKGSYLENPVHDADSVAKKLKGLNFDVIKITDCTLRDMNESIKDFAKKATDYDVALFFYAGHGMQSEGENYLIPINAELETQADVKYNCTSLNYLLDKLDECGCPMKIIVLDACRNNPLARSWSRSVDKGLAIVNPPKGTFITFSTAAGKTALDGDGHNSPYTTAFIESLEKPNLALFDFFNEVGRSVLAMTDNKQDPWANHSTMGGRFVFNEVVSKVQSNSVHPYLTQTDNSREIVIDNNVAGKLHERIPFNALKNVVSLTVSGDMNGSDFAYLRGAYSQNLKSFNLKNAHIVEGGMAYYDNYYTKDSIIGDDMFINAKSLETIILPNSIHAIGNGAFYGCSSLSSIHIPSNVTIIGKSAFMYCSSLTSINLPENLTTVENGAFRGCSSLLSIVLPNDITSIEGFVFAGCSNLSSITLPDNVMNIDSYAFSGCSKLTSLNIPKNVKSIGDCAFEGCTSITSITIPQNVTFLGTYFTFKGCSSLTSITLPNGLTSIGRSLFEGCSNLTTIAIPDNVTSIEDDAFRECSNLSSIIIPKSVTYIGSSSFFGCSSLKSIDFPYGLKSIGFNAFSNCSGLSTIILPNSVVSLGSSAFYDCKLLSTITIPKRVTTIGDLTFAGCSNLTSVTISNSVVSIGSSAFDGCTGLTSLNIPPSVTSIGKSAFRGCSNIVSLTIPNSVTLIDEYAFECYRLKDIYSNMTDLNNIVFGYAAFSYCPKEITWHVLSGKAKEYKSQPWWIDTWAIIEDIED